MIGATLLVVSQLVAADAALEQCRKLDREFDSKNMPKPCQAAADNSAAAVADRVEALRLLAFAHILNGDEALAEPAFLKMLVFSPSAELPADAGPQFRTAFAAARKRFDAEGQVTTTFTAPVVDPARREPVAVQVDVADRLGRVVGARVRSTAAVAPAPMEARMTRSELGPGQARFSGTVPEPSTPEGYSLAWEIVLDGWDGTSVPVATPLGGSLSRDPSVGATAAPQEGPPWPWIIGGGAGAVLAAGAVAGGITWCIVAGPCRPQSAWVRVQVSQGAAP